MQLLFSTKFGDCPLNHIMKARSMEENSASKYLRLSNLCSKLDLVITFGALLLTIIWALVNVHR